MKRVLASGWALSCLLLSQRRCPAPGAQAQVGAGFAAQVGAEEKGGHSEQEEPGKQLLSQCCDGGRKSLVWTKAQLLLF